MKFWKLASAAITLVLSTNVNAALIERLGGLAYYDNVADLTWLADANAGAGSAFDNSTGNGSSNDGLMTWANANAWVASLDIAGVTGWRLPDVPAADFNCSESVIRPLGFNCTDSELGNMFYNVLGGATGLSITTSHNSNYDLFINIQSNLYWSKELAEGYPLAYILNFSGGYQGTLDKVFSTSVWAVHDGDVSAVPVPAAVWLFGSGLIGLIGFARRKA